MYITSSVEVVIVMQLMDKIQLHVLCLNSALRWTWWWSLESFDSSVGYLLVSFNSMPVNAWITPNLCIHFLRNTKWSYLEIGPRWEFLNNFSVFIVSHWKKWDVYMNDLFLNLIWSILTSLSFFSLSSSCERADELCWFWWQNIIFLCRGTKWGVTCHHMSSNVTCHMFYHAYSRL